jgi:hypothetical protein
MAVEREGGWTVETLRRHMEAMLDAADKRYEQRFLAQADATLKAESASEKRFDSVNEFRGSLDDMVHTLMPRTESEARHTAASEKIDLLQARLDKSEGSGAGMRQGWTLVVGAIATVGVVMSLIAAFRPAAVVVPSESSARIDDMNARMNALSARLNQQPPPAK